MQTKLNVCFATLIAIGAVACGQSRPATTGPAAAPQLVKLNEPYGCVNAKAAIETMISTDRTTASRFHPNLQADSQRFLEDILSQMANQPRKVKALIRIGKTLITAKESATEDEKNFKFFEQLHADLLTAAQNSAEKLFGSPSKCITSNPQESAFPDSSSSLEDFDFAIACNLPEGRSLTVNFESLESKSQAPVLTVRSFAITDSSLVKGTTRYTLEVSSRAWHAFQSLETMKNIESEAKPNLAARNVGTQSIEFENFDTMDKDQRQAMVKALLPQGCN